MGMSSPYRSVLGPLSASDRDLRLDDPGRAVAVVLPQLVEARWWERVLHRTQATSAHRDCSGTARRDLAIVGVPWNLRAPEPELLRLTPSRGPQ